MSKQREGYPRELPIACRLTGEEQSKRREDLARELFSRSEEINELDDGYEVVFPGDTRWAEALVSFIISERECCPFLTFEMIFETDEGHISLRMRGPDGVKEFVGAELAGLGAQ